MGKKPVSTKSKAKKPPVGNSSQVKGQQTKQPRTKVISTKTKKKKVAKKSLEKSEEADISGTVSSGKNLLSRTLEGPLVSLSDRLKPPEAGTLEDRKSEGANILRVSDAPRRNDSKNSVSVSSSNWDSKQQARAEERRMEVERKRAEKRKLLLKQQKEEDERLRLKVSVI